MHRRFPLLELFLVILGGIAGALLLVQLTLYEYGTAVDLVAGRRLDYRRLFGIVFLAKERRSILSGYYREYVGQYPDETHWVVSSSGIQRPFVLQKYLPEPPPPRHTAITDAIHELNQFIEQQEHPRGSLLSHQARAAVIERTLKIARLSGDAELAFNYVRGMRNQFDDLEGIVGPSAFPTAEQYLDMMQAGP
jgi:hypothetical protein